MLNFFEQQAQAKRRTAVLVFLYFIGVCIFVAILTPLVLAFGLAIGYFFASKERFKYEPFRNLTELIFTSPLEAWTNPEVQLLFGVACVVSAILVFGASCRKAAQLRSLGGKGIAESMDGRLVVHSPDLALYQKRLLNVVEEMAIASGIPVPQVYLLDDEHSINAFAAGYTSSDAVVAVTRGAAKSLSREQLQGVIAHEFSHILSGDMRLNVRLIGLLFGILAVQMFGASLLGLGSSSRSSRKSGKGAGVLMVFGLLFFLLGILGATIAQIIKALISRQCEYRADAALIARFIAGLEKDDA